MYVRLARMVKNKYQKNPGANPARVTRLPMSQPTIPAFNSTTGMWVSSAWREWKADEKGVFPVHQEVDHRGHQVDERNGKPDRE